MNSKTRTQYAALLSADGELQNAGYQYLINETEQPVDWAYEVWDDLLAYLRHKNNRVRSIAAQLLSNLAQSDPDKCMLTDFAALLVVTKDEKFVTARHALQSLWKVGLVGDEQRQMVIAGLAGRFHDSVAEKNCTLIRYDIIQNLKQLYNVIPDESIREQAKELIATEADEKYNKKYKSVWKFK
jgi:hypothetical protein